MSFVTVLVIVFVLVVINICLWKFGFIHEAEKPKLVDDKPVMNARERKAILKRVERWKAEGKLSRAEHQNLLELCENDWD